MTLNATFHKFYKKNNINLSIITVVKDDENGLLLTMNSLKILNSNCFEHIVWINSKTKLLKSHIDIASLYADIVISGDDNGIFDAMNNAIRYASGSFLLFLNARDLVIRPFDIHKIERPALIPVRYLDYFGRVRFVRPAKTVKLGIPYCHQGILLPRIGYYYDIKYKFGADYTALLNFNISWPLPLLSTGLIEYDTTGISSVNRWESDKWTFYIIKERFGYFWALTYLGRSIIKLGLKRAYDLINYLKSRCLP
jgi:hypothetical protein